MKKAIKIINLILLIIFFIIIGHSLINLISSNNKLDILNNELGILNYELEGMFGVSYISGGHNTDKPFKIKDSLIINNITVYMELEYDGNSIKYDYKKQNNDLWK